MSRRIFLVACLAICLVALSPSVSRAESASPRELLRQGNGLYAAGKYAEAINKYNDALVEQPQAVEPKFNKANSYYRMDDLGEALDLYQEAAAESKDMKLVAKSKYNLGNCFFQRGTKQRDSDLQKAVDDMKTSITYWRQVLEIDPKNEKAARNIEVARLTIKDILDQIKQQQQDQQNQQDPNQPNQPQPQDQQQDPNQPGQQQSQEQQQDPNQPQQGARPQDPNESQEQQQPQPQDQGQQPEQKFEPDATAQEIIDNEQRQKKEREILQRGRLQPVERDW